MKLVGLICIVKSALAALNSFESRESSDSLSEAWKILDRSGSEDVQAATLVSEICWNVITTATNPLDFEVEILAPNSPRPLTLMEALISVSASAVTFDAGLIAKIIQISPVRAYSLAYKYFHSSSDDLVEIVTELYYLDPEVCFNLIRSHRMDLVNDWHLWVVLGKLDLTGRLFDGLDAEDHLKLIYMFEPDEMALGAYECILVRERNDKLINDLPNETLKPVFELLNNWKFKYFSPDHRIDLVLQIIRQTPANFLSITIKHLARTALRSRRHDLFIPILNEASHVLGTDKVLRELAFSDPDVVDLIRMEADGYPFLKFVNLPERPLEQLLAHFKVKELGEVVDKVGLERWADMAVHCDRVPEMLQRLRALQAPTFDYLRTLHLMTQVHSSNPQLYTWIRELAEIHKSSRHNGHFFGQSKQLKFSAGADLNSIVSLLADEELLSSGLLAYLEFQFTPPEFLLKAAINSESITDALASSKTFLLRNALPSAKAANKKALLMCADEGQLTRLMRLFPSEMDFFESVLGILRESSFSRLHSLELLLKFCQQRDPEHFAEFDL